MSNPGDNGSWNTQGNGHDASSGQEPWAQPPADPYGQQDPSAQPSAADPYGQQPAGDPFAQQPADPFAQQPGSAPSAADPYGQQPGSAPSAADPYGQSGQSWSPAGGPGSASDPFAQPAAGAEHGQGGYAQQPGAVPAGEAPSRLLVGLMGIFLGGFGVHRFLMGYTTIGIIQIVVTVVTCGIGAWWGLIEGIMVLAKSESFLRDAHGRPLTD